MTSNWTYTVTHYDESNSWASTVLQSHDVDTLPLFTDQGSGEVNRAIVKLNAPNGKFLTTSPIIDQFDKIRIQGTDGQGGTYNRVYEVSHIRPVEDNPTGTMCELDCLGNEWYTQYIHYSRNFFFETAFGVGKDVGELYNDNIGSKQPTLQYHDVPYNPTDSTDSNGTPSKLGNGLPEHIANVYDYGTVERPCYDTWNELVDQQGSSVDLGGSLDFYELGFDTDVTDLHKIYMRIFSSGQDPQEGGGTPVTIDGTDGGTSVNLQQDESEGGIAAQSATRVMSWGELGSIPVSWARYLAGEVDFIFRPLWREDSIKYFKDSRVKHRGKHWKAKQDHISSTSRQPPASGSSNDWWEQITFMSEVGNKIQYSPYTDDKAPLWKFAGSAADTGTPKMWDGNLVINYTDPNNENKKFRRTWATDSSLTGPNDYFIDEAVNNDVPVRGHRVLNKVPNLSGTDPNTGKLFQQSILEWVPLGETSGVAGWRVKWDPRDFDDKFQCEVISEGKTYEWNASTQTWTDISGQAAANDCFHPYNSIENIDGPQEGSLIDGETKTFTSGNPNHKSAVEITSTFSLIDSITSADNYYKAFAGLCFQYPFPVRTSNAYGERVGDLYGNSSTGEPATFDPQNMNLTEDGNRGFNHPDSESLGASQGLSFFTRIKYELGDTTNRDGRELLVANIPIRVTCYDTQDNVVIQDQNVPFRNNWFELFFPVNQFKIYRGAVPIFKADDIPDVLKPLEQESANVFEWRNLKMISIQVQSFFDNDGRYSPLRELTTGEFLNPQTKTPMFGATVKLAIDALRWTKRNLATSGTDSERNIEAPFLQRNQVFSHNQLTKDAIAQQQVHAFRHREYVIGTQGKFDIRFGDSFFYKNPRTVFVPQSDRVTGEEANKIKLVAKKIEYSITKTKNGKGGFIRRIYGVKRFT